jgi:hypothetical protein
MSAAFSWSLAARLIAAQLAWFLTLLAAVSAAHKAFDPARARQAARELLPDASANGAALAVVAAMLGEACAALLMLAPSLRALGASLAALVWTGYFLVLARAARAGRTDLDCGCSFGAGHRSLGRFQLVRGAVLVGLAAVVVAARLGAGTAADSGPDPANAAALGLTAAALLVLYAALDQVMALGPLRSGEVA